MKSITKIVFVFVAAIVVLVSIAFVGLSAISVNLQHDQVGENYHSNFLFTSVSVSPPVKRGSQIMLEIPGSVDKIVELTSLPSGSVSAQTIQGDKFVFGGTFTLNEGDRINGNLIILGGIATLEADSLVEEDVILMGGNLEINGTVEGEVVAIGGLLVLGPSAIVEGNVTVLAGHLSRSSSAEVFGDVVTGLVGPISITVPGGLRIPIPGGEYLPGIRILVNPLWEGLWVLFRAIMMSAIAVLVILFLPKQTARIGNVAIKQAPVSGGIGCLTTILFPIVLVITAITIIGLPITFFTVLLFILTVMFGVIAVGTETGVRLGKIFNQSWVLAVSAGVGTFLLVLVMEGLRVMIPCIGSILYIVVTIIGIGAVLLTRFGTRDYPSYVTAQEPSEEPTITESEDNAIATSTREDESDRSEGTAEDPSQ